MFIGRYTVRGVILSAPSSTPASSSIGMKRPLVAPGGGIRSPLDEPISPPLENTLVNILDLLIFGWGADHLHTFLYVLLCFIFRMGTTSLTKVPGNAIRIHAENLYDAANMINQEERDQHEVREVRVLILCILGLDTITQQLVYRNHVHHKLLFGSTPPPSENIIEFKTSLKNLSDDYVNGVINANQFMEYIRDVYKVYKTHIVTIRKSMQLTNVQYSEI